MTPSSASCRKVRDLLPLHVGGDLDRRDTRRVDEHLHHCLPCFREFRELAAVRARLGVLADAPLPRGVLDGFTDEVMARLALDEPGPAAPVLVRRRMPRWAQLAAAAALVGAIGLGGAWSPSGNAVPAAPPSAPVDGTLAAAPDAVPTPSDEVPRPAWPGELIGATQAWPAGGGVQARPVAAGTSVPSGYLVRPPTFVIDSQSVELLRAHLRASGAPLDPLPTLQPDDESRQPRERP